MPTVVHFTDIYSRGIYLAVDQIVSVTVCRAASRPAVEEQVDEHFDERPDAYACWVIEIRDSTGLRHLIGPPVSKSEAVAAQWATAKRIFGETIELSL